MKKTALLINILTVQFVAYPQLKQDFIYCYLGSSKSMHGIELIGYKDGYAMAYIMPSKTDTNKYVLATTARDFNNKYVTGYFYDQISVNKNLKDIYDYYPKEFIKLSNGHYMICGKGYVIELDENLKYVSNYSKTKFNYQSLSEGLDNQVVVSYVDEDGNIGTLVYNIHNNTVFKKTVSFKPKYSSVESTVVNDSMFVAVYSFTSNNKVVSGIALKSYNSIVTKNAANNFRWEFSFPDYTYIAHLQKSKYGQLVGVRVDDDSENKELFVFDYRQKKVIHKLNIIDELKANNLKSENIRLVQKDNHYVIIAKTEFKDPTKVDKGVWKWMANSYSNPYAIVLNSSLGVVKKGFLIDPTQENQIKYFKRFGTLLIDESTSELFITTYNMSYEESHMIHTKFEW